MMDAKLPPPEKPVPSLIGSGADAGSRPVDRTAALTGKSTTLMRAIRRILRAVDVQSKRVSRASGLTIPQIVILQTLREHGPISTRRLSAEISLSPPTVTTILDRLEGRGIVRRTRMEADRRVVLTELTAEGSAILDRAPPLMHASFLAAFDRMDGARQDELVRALATVADLMDAEQPPPALLMDEGERRA